MFSNKAPFRSKIVGVFFRINPLSTQYIFFGFLSNFLSVFSNRWTEKTRYVSSAYSVYFCIVFADLMLKLLWMERYVMGFETLASRNFNTILSSDGFRGLYRVTISFCTISLNTWVNISSFFSTTGSGIPPFKMYSLNFLDNWAFCSVE